MPSIIYFYLETFINNDKIRSLIARMGLEDYKRDIMLYDDVCTGQKNEEIKEEEKDSQGMHRTEFQNKP